VKLFINGAITVDQSEILSVRKATTEAPTP
jgi:hypothetical protein